MHAHVYRTVFSDPSLRLRDEGEFVFGERDPETKEAHVVNVYPEIRMQEITGIGGAATESASYCWAHLNEKAREDFIRDYFDPEEGIGYSFLRIHIGAADFSLSPYHNVEEGDFELKSFSLERDRQYVIPFLKEVQKRYAFTLMASPWTPPPFMKDNGSYVGGRLLPEYYDAWARCLARFAEEYRKEGLAIDRITLQNEPWHAKTWESCGFTHEEEHAFALAAAKYLKPLGVKIYFWDHNRQDILRAAGVMFRDEAGRGAADGIAYHLYTGENFEEIRLFRRLYPDKDIFFSEGCAFDEETGIKVKNVVPFAEKYARELIRNLNSGASGFVDWNLALDERCGPSNLREGRKRQCDAPIRTLSDGTYLKTLSYYAIGHFSRFIRPGAFCIGQSSYHEDLLTAAFLNPDGKIAAILFNRGEKPLPVQLILEGKALYFDMEPKSLRTLVIREGEKC